MAETRRGFRLVYRAVQSACNSTLSAATAGTIASPNDAGTKCSWTIHAPVGHVVSLLFDRFYLQQTEECSRDYLVIQDGGGSIVGRYCGYQKGELVYSSSAAVTLEYQATSGLENTGFQIHYKAVQFECGGYLNSSRGSLQSPLFPNNYPSNVKCAWQIEQRPGYTVDLVFDKLDLEFAVNCTRDYLEAFDGPDNSSQSLGKFCRENDAGRHVVSSGNVMFVEFVSDGRVSKSGFQASFTEFKTDCPRNFTNASGIIQSPNYPDFYPKSYDCQWLISYALGYQIYLTFSYFELEYSAQCSTDYVELLDGSGVNATSRGKYCGYLVRRDALVSAGHQMVVRLHTDGQGLHRGFVLSYQVDGTGPAPPPRTPSLSEEEQALEITIGSLTTDEWITNMDILFKKLAANATTIYCASNPENCQILNKARARRADEVQVSFPFHQVHLVPSFPAPANHTRNLLVVFYVLYPEGVSLVPSWKSTALPQEALVKAINSSADYISTAFGAAIISITPYSSPRRTTTPPPTGTTPPPTGGDESDHSLLIGLTVAGVLLFLCVAVFVSCFYWRKRNHGKFLAPRSVTPVCFEHDRMELKTPEIVRKKPIMRKRTSIKITDLEMENNN